MPEETRLTLAGRHAVVTGAGRGIGRSIALALAEAGADVAVTARTVSELERLVTEIQAMGRSSIAIPCDVTNVDQVQHMAMTFIEVLGHIDILVNNAGNAASHKLLNHPDELWHRMLAINLTSVYYVTKAFMPTFIEQKSGRIINIASIASRVGYPYIAAYVAAKHGTLGLTRALAAEMMPYNVTVNAICPGYINTPMTASNIRNIAMQTGMTEAQVRETMEKMNPQQRLIEPEEVAALVVHLAQDISKGITGQAINLDGGAIMS